MTKKINFIVNQNSIYFVAEDILSLLNYKNFKDAIATLKMYSYDQCQINKINGIKYINSYTAIALIKVSQNRDKVKVLNWFNRFCLPHIERFKKFMPKTLLFESSVLLYPDK